MQTRRKQVSLLHEAEKPTSVILRDAFKTKFYNGLD
jgi:hypothetical protein